jgi:hypothetical protein
MLRSGKGEKKDRKNNKVFAAPLTQQKLPKCYVEV